MDCFVTSFLAMTTFGGFAGAEATRMSVCVIVRAAGPWQSIRMSANCHLEAANEIGGAFDASIHREIFFVTTVPDKIFRESFSFLIKCSNHKTRERIEKISGEGEVTKLKTTGSTGKSSRTLVTSALFPLFFIAPPLLLPFPSGGGSFFRTAFRRAVPAHPVAPASR
jgi:hypothetical protein